MKKLILLLLVVAAALAVMLKGSLVGSIFIATQGGQTVKLGAIEVRAYPAADIAEHMQARKLAYIRECPSLEDVKEVAGKVGGSSTMAQYNAVEAKFLECHSPGFYIENLPAFLVVA